MSLEFHHIGIACRDLDNEMRRMMVLGYSAERCDFVDPIQGVKGRFLVGGGPRLELLVECELSGVLTPWLTVGVKLYHMAYATTDFDFEFARLCQGGAKIIVKPVQAVAFGGKRIAFLMLPSLLLVELIERQI
jgi:methylmalonyl-CoA/ethylmalonyl-CoA epimerase